MQLKTIKKSFLFTFILILTYINISTIHAEDNKYNMSYIYFGNSSQYSNLVNYTNDTLNEVSPNYFNISETGSLILTNAIDKNFIDEMHKKEIKVVPFISNHWNRSIGQAALKNREALVKEIAKVIDEYNLDGINVDLENLTENERDQFTDFIRLLRIELPKDKIIAVAVAPNPYGLKKGWQGSYDYTQISKYSDYIMIMAYDEHYQNGPAGAVASYSFVEKSIQYALLKVPKEKIVLGIAFYGRYWQSGRMYGGYGISAKDVEKLITKYNGKVVFDSITKSPKAVVTIKSGDIKPTVGGKKLETGTYTIWYENENSIKAKLSLIQKYDIKGSGSWSLGQEPKGTWDYYYMWSNGYYLSDAQGHWAKSYILSMIEKGLMKGTSDTSFDPNAKLTRAQAAVVLVRALELNKTTTLAAPFDDIDAHWAKKEIEIAYQHDIVKGTGDRIFSPDAPITRQEIAVMIDRILGPVASENTQKNEYLDICIEDNSWSYNSILRLTSFGIFTGYADGGFYPANNTTRAEMAVLMERLIPHLEVNNVYVALNR